MVIICFRSELVGVVNEQRRKIIGFNIEVSYCAIVDGLILAKFGHDKPEFSRKFVVLFV
jgi:hypothetical protein